MAKGSPEMISWGIQMRVMLVTYYFEPKLGYQEPNLAKQLAKMGQDVYVVTSNKRYPSARIYQSLSHSIGERETENGYSLHQGIKIIRLRTKVEIFLRTWLVNLEKTILELKPDVVHVNGITRFSSLRIAFLKWRKRLRFKLIYDEHMVYSVVRRDFLGKIFYALFRLLIKPLLLSQGSAFVAVTEETKVFMNRECGIPLSRIEVIPLAVDHHLFRFDELSRKRIRGRYDISENDVVYIYAGKIIPRKGPHLLIDAGQRLFEKHGNLRILFLGNGEREYINHMKDHAENNGFHRQIIWHGGVENKDLRRFYSAADVGVWPMEESMTMLEAAACGLPIIIRDSLSLKDRISNNNGLRYREDDTRDLARCMETLLIDGNLRREMGKRARELVEKRMNWELMAKRYVELYSRPASS